MPLPFFIVPKSNQEKIFDFPVIFLDGFKFGHKEAEVAYDVLDNDTARERTNDFEYFREIRFEDEEHSRSKTVINDKQLKILDQADTRKTN